LRFPHLEVKKPDWTGPLNTMGTCWNILHFSVLVYSFLISWKEGV
jgi:tryptophan-rich sensory protein